MADFVSREKHFRKLNEQLDEFKNLTLDKIANTQPRRSPLGQRNKTDTQLQHGTTNRDRFATYTKPKAQNHNSVKRNGGNSPPISPNSNRSTGLSTRTHMLRSTHRNYRKKNPFKVSDEPLILKYRNEKFSSSPSKDNLLTESLETLESNQQKEIDGASNSLPHESETSSHTLESSNGDGKNVKKFVNTNGLIRFLKSKVTLLEENQAQTLQDMAQQKEVIESSAEQLKSMQQHRDKALSRISTLSEQNEKLSAQVIEINQRNKEQSRTLLTQQKELDTLRRELKQFTLTHKNLEKRYTRTKDELDASIKEQSSLKNNVKELKQNLSRDSETSATEIKHLKKQRSDLFAAYKRQMYLIDNLKQQNLCMEQAKLIDFCEKDFSKVLEWNVKP